MVGVETSGTRSFRAVLEAGHLVDIEIGGRAKDGLCARRVGAIPFVALGDAGAGVAVVEDDDVHVVDAASRT